MAAPAILKGTYLDIAVNTTGNTYVSLCGLTAKTFTQQKNSSDVFVPDCDDPESIAVRRLNITGRQWDLSGDGLYNRAQAPLIRQLLDELEPRKFRFSLGEPDGEDVDAGYFEGFAQMLTASLGGPAGGEFSTLSTTISSDGEWIWHDA